jgi:hypothetical protein
MTVLKHLLAALILFGLGTSGLVLAQCPTGYCPTRKTYSPAPIYRAPVIHRKHFRPRIVIADAYFPVFDYRVKDVFVFTGPVVVAAPGVAGGQPVAASGQPGGQYIRPTTPAVLPPAAAGTLKALIAADEANGVIGLRGYEGRSTPVTPAPPATPAAPDKVDVSFLRNACAECHTAPRVKGSFTLFAGDGSLAPGVSWKQVLSAVSSADGQSPPAMPPGNRPKLNAQQLDSLRLLAR